MTNARSITDLLPLTPATFHVLLALSDGERHGYAITQEIEQRSGGLVRVGPGTLYRSIEKMLADDLIEECTSARDRRDDDERRRYYRMTKFGRAVAEAEAQRLSDVVGLARSKRLLRKPRTT